MVMVMNALKGGLYCKKPEIALESLQVLGNLAADFDALELGTLAWQWYVSAEGGLDGTLHALRKHSQTADAVATLIVHIAKGKLQDLFKQHVKALVPEPEPYWRLLATLMAPLGRLQVAEEQQQEVAGVIENLFDACSRLADNDGRHSLAQRSVSLGCLCEMWLAFPSVCEAKEEVANYILTALTRGTRDKSGALQMYSLALMFALLDGFAEQKRPFAPALYKAATFALVESYESMSVRSFITDNIIAMHKKHQAIPVSILIEPWAKQIKQLGVMECALDLCDFSLLFTLATHPKLNVKGAIQLLDVLAQVALNDLLLTPIAKSALVAVANHVLPDTDVQDYLTKFIKVQPAPTLVGVFHDDYKRSQTTSQEEAAGPNKKIPQLPRLERGSKQRRAGRQSERAFVASYC